MHAPVYVSYWRPKAKAWRPVLDKDSVGKPRMAPLDDATFADVLRLSSGYTAPYDWASHRQR